MHENGEGNKRWFSIDSKSFEITMEGGGNKLKGIITKWRKGFVSWIRFEEADLVKLLKGFKLFAERKARSKGYSIGRRMGDSIN